MCPVLFSVGPFEVYSYGLMLAIAFIVCILLASKEAPKQGFDEDQIFTFSLLVIIAGLIGARLGFVVQKLPYYLKHPKEIFFVSEGGLSLHGALLLSLLVGWWYTSRKKIHYGKLANLLAPFVALGIAIGRIGCFLNGCCYGKEAIPPWGFSFDGGLPVYPIQLWESGFCFLLFWILWRFREGRRDWELFLSFITGYSLIRFFTEFWRWGSILFLSLTLAQWVSLGVIIVSLIILRSLKKQDAAG